MIPYALAVAFASVVVAVGLLIRPHTALSLPPVVREREPEVTWEVARA